jgi:DNA-binding transcriptional ArsR family regulator
MDRFGTMDLELTQQAHAYADFCAIFNNVYRILILWLLLDNDEMAVNQIAKSIGAKGQNTSQHLRLMKDRGFLTTRREGTTIYYRLVRSQILDMSGLIERRPEMNR